MYIVNNMPIYQPSNLKWKAKEGEMAFQICSTQECRNTLIIRTVLYYIHVNALPVRQNIIVANARVLNCCLQHISQMVSTANIGNVIISTHYSRIMNLNE